jgi:hypothetical protein
MRGAGRVAFAGIILLITLGAFQLTGGFSLLSGNAYGRVIGVIAGSIGAIFSLISVAGASPWWSLGMFFLCCWVVWESSFTAKT